MNAGSKKYRAVARKIAERHITNAKNRMFVRLLGKNPMADKIKGTMAYNAPLFRETFGPPEIKPFKKSTLFFWNFQSADGATGFSIFAEVPKHRASQDVEAHLATHRSAPSFSTWTVDRLNTVANGDEPPTFLGSGEFVISRLVE